MKSKKGISIGLLVWLILGIVAFALIVGFIMKTNQGAEGKAAEILCHDSVAKRVAFATRGGEAKWYPLLCSTQKKDIEGTRKEIKLQLANLMSRCWWMMHEGRYEEFVAESTDPSNFANVARILNLNSLNNQCFICYVALTQDEEIDGGPIHSREMMDFLIQEDYPTLGIKYLDYFQSYGGPGYVMITDENINHQSAYAVVFSPQNSNEEGFFATFQEGILSGAALLGLYTFANRETSAIILDTIVNAQEHCIADLSEQISEISSGS